MPRVALIIYKRKERIDMGYIYCITNLINSKRYVGKTTSTIELRFKEHCRDSRRLSFEKRPLYDAMNKYGIENFIVEELEQVEDSKLDEREIYWILELGTSGCSGYNATKGGDGKVLYDHTEIIELARLGYTSKQISDKVGCCPDTIYTVLKANGVKLRKSDSKVVLQYDLAGNFVLTFYSVTEAVEWLYENGFTKSKEIHTKITNCCKGKSKSAYKYKWKFRDD